MARPSGDAAAGVSWSHPGGGCFTASGEGVRLGAILVGRRGRGFCCSVASSAGAGATLRLGPIVEAAQMAAQQAVAKAASDGTNSSVEQSPQPCVVDTRALQQSQRQRCCSFGSYLGCSSPTNCASAKQAKYLQGVGSSLHASISTPGRSQSCKPCVYFQDGFFAHDRDFQARRTRLVSHK